eukprot:CAMPEP_0198207030 /NCGR_PEP_ID=MMETSP1445-20131203/10526_1 /TAXON_ID=36898 /ORGANISM="Pyramimonas sp., Strain CCMP2087" /LENGTH=322 /DNA_ID=CAMNT_0043879925 /DNA_START=153 /DNA_END=1121 /DNA_ORIENTATION=+
MKCTSAQALTRAEQYLAAGLFSEAESLATQIVKGEYHTLPEDSSHQLATAFVVIQSLHQAGRLQELRCVVPRLYGNISNLPADATLLWASLLVLDGDILDAKELLERHILPRELEHSGNPNLVAAASRLYAIDVLAKGQKDSHAALVWLEEYCSQIAESREASQEFLPQALIAEMKAELSTQLPASEAPNASSTEAPQLEAKEALPCNSNVSESKLQQQDLTGTKGWVERATDALYTALGSARGTSGTNGQEQMIKDPQQALMYMAAAGTLAYCVIAERRNIYRMIRCSAGHFKDMTQMAVSLGNSSSVSPVPARSQALRST